MNGKRNTATRGEFIQYRNNRIKLQYLCGYFPSKFQPDAASRSLILFKRNAPEHVESWTRYATQAITLGPDCLILRALSSHETKIVPGTTPGHPLDTLCTDLAKRYGCLYQPWLLTKLAVTKPLRGMNRDDRWRMLWDQYRLVGRIDTSRIKQVLLVDDIVTTGTTFRALIRLLNFHYPSLPIAAFALGRTAEKRGGPKLKHELSYNKWFSGELSILKEDAEAYIPLGIDVGEITLTDFDDEDTFIVK